MATITKPIPTGAMATQPVITITAITSLASAILATLALAVQLPPDTERVVLTLITAAYPVITAAWTWHKVYSPKTAQQMVNDAAVTGEAAKMDPPPPTKSTAPRDWLEMEVQRSLNADPKTHGVNQNRDGSTV
jgi:hypothetical protein